LLTDKVLFRKRSMIESTNNQLKNVFHLEHTKHRRMCNGFANIIVALIAYVFHPSKPSVLLTNKEYKNVNLQA